MRHGAMPLQIARVCAVAALAVAAASPPSSGAPAIEASIRALARPGRARAPFWVEVRLRAPGRRPVSGRLEIELFTAGTTWLRYTTPELAVSGAASARRLLLPAMGVSPAGLATGARMRFLAGAAAVDLGTSALLDPPRGDAVVYVGFAGDLGASRALSCRDIVDALRPRAILAGLLPAGADVRAAAVPLAAVDLPGDPVACCALDLLVLAGDGLAGFGDGQLEAIATWVRAGGSLCVLSARGLSERHVAFLRRLAGPRRGAFSLRGGGRLVLPVAPVTSGKTAGATGGVSLHRAGLGRLAVLSDAAGDAGGRDVEEWLWPAVSAFLWNVRASFVENARARFIVRGERLEPVSR